MLVDIASHCAPGSHTLHDVAEHPLAVKLTDGPPWLESYFCQDTFNTLPSAEGKCQVWTRVVICTVGSMNSMRLSTTTAHIWGHMQGQSQALQVHCTL